MSTELPTAAVKVCAYCGEAAEGTMLPADPNLPGSPVIAESHPRCNRARLMLQVRRAAAASDVRLRKGVQS